VGISPSVSTLCQTWQKLISFITQTHSPEKSEWVELTKATAFVLTIHVRTQAQSFSQPHFLSLCHKRHLNNFDKCVINSNILATKAVIFHASMTAN